MGTQKQLKKYPNTNEHESHPNVAEPVKNLIIPEPSHLTTSKNTTINSEDLCANDETACPPLNRAWYGSNWSWRSKPSTDTVLENIITPATSNVADDAASSKSTEYACVKSKPNPPVPLDTTSRYFSRSSESLSRSLPLAATITKLNVVSQIPDLPVRDALRILKLRSSNEASSGPGTDNGANQTQETQQHHRGLPQIGSPTKRKSSIVIFRADGNSISTRNPRNKIMRWPRWFSDSADINTTMAMDSQMGSASEVMSTESESPEQQRALKLSSSPDPTQADQVKHSWVGIWKSSAIAPRKYGTTATIEASATNPDVIGEPQNVIEILEQDKKIVEPATSKPARFTYLPQLTNSYNTVWNFWSGEKMNGDLTSKREGGKICLPESPSRSNSESAKIEDMSIISKGRKEPQPRSSADNNTSIENPNKSLETGRETLILTIDPHRKIVAQSSPDLKQGSANILLPLVKGTYQTIETPSFIQRLNHLFHLSGIPNFKHVRIQEPGVIKKAVAIGIHGYFPATVLRSVLGHPTGTSIRFANSAADAIKRWTKNRGYPCDVEIVALEGEGKITDRVDILWKLMLKWVENIRKADFVIIACHSQGVPVAVMLVAKLIAFGCTGQSRIGICALAGVNLGPFADYRSRWIGGSAGELFDFALPESQVSKNYEVALSEILMHGVRAVYIGSIDDQLVSLESSTFGTVSHPYIYRAVFVDGRIHAPDLYVAMVSHHMRVTLADKLASLTHLVGFAFKLRNLGISDHSLIRELSSPLAGSLYSGEGHSRIYEDDAVYDLAVEFALETASVGKIPIQIQRKATQTSQNPYILPFAMRGLLEEEYVRTQLWDETLDLLRQFDLWKPSSKVLKDVKFRLEGVRSKL